MDGLIIENMAFAEYLERDGLSASSLKKGVKSMLHMKDLIDNGFGDEKPCMLFGTASHIGLLEPEKLDEFIMLNDLNRNTNEFKALKAEQSAKDVTVIKTAQYESILAMSTRAHSIPAISHLIENTKHEVAVFWDHRLYGSGKCRPDGYSEKMGIVEYKTTARIEPRDFLRSAYNLGYHIAIGWYCHGIEQITGTIPPYTFIVQESKAPFDLYLMPVPMPVIEQCIEQAVELARRWTACKVTGTYTGVTNGEEVEFSLPDYATPDKIDMEGI